MAPFQEFWRQHAGLSRAAGDSIRWWPDATTAASCWRSLRGQVTPAPTPPATIAQNSDLDPPTQHGRPATRAALCTTSLDEVLCISDLYPS